MSKLLTNQNFDNFDMLKLFRHFDKSESWCQYVKIILTILTCRNSLISTGNFSHHHKKSIELLRKRWKYFLYWKYIKTNYQIILLLPFMNNCQKFRWKKKYKSDGIIIRTNKMYFFCNKKTIYILVTYFI